MLPQNRRRIVANALKSLATFIGEPGLFSSFKTRYKIRYGSGQNQALHEILNGSQSLDEIVKWLVEKVRPLGWRYYFPAAFTVYTGLRASEGFTAVKLASKGLGGYYNADLRCLEHFRHPEFLRRTKNAYISFISDDLRDLLEQRIETVSFRAFISKLKREKIPMRLKEARKAWASELRKVIPSEGVDLLQGRISPSVFAKHYYRPDLKELSKKVLSALEPFEKRLFGEIPSLRSSSTPGGEAASA